MVNSKACGRCKQIKPLADFNKQTRNRDGHSNRCRFCDNAASAAYRAKNPERVKEAVAKWKRKNSKRNSAINLRYKAKNRSKYSDYAHARRARQLGGGNFVILDKELKRIKEQPCFYCGSLENPTLDHIISLARGGRHSVGNLIASCAKCNSTKGARTITEFQKYRRKINETNF